MLPAIRSLQALPAPAQQAMASFLELLDRVPITEEVVKALAAVEHQILTPQISLGPCEDQADRSHGAREGDLHQYD